MRATSKRRRVSARATSAAFANRSTRPYEEPRGLSEGQVRCPVCRKGVRPLTSGYLRQHADLFGLPCYNRRPPEAS